MLVEHLPVGNEQDSDENAPPEQESGDALPVEERGNETERINNTTRNTDPKERECGAEGGTLMLA